MDVRDTDWRQSYAKRTRDLIRKHGGREVAPFGSTVDALEGAGKVPSTIVILEFPSVKQAKAWHQDSDYAPLIALRQSGADEDLVVVDAH